MKKGGAVVGVFVAWALVYLLFAVLKPSTFLSLDNLELMLRQSVIDGFGAIGMTYVIITGGIDLSAGSVIALSMVVGAVALKVTGRPEIACLAAVLVGLLSGLLNGTLVTKLKVGPFIVTLASMLALRGIAKGMANEQTVSGLPTTWMNVFTAALGPGEKWMLIPRGAWIWLICVGLFTWALQYTVFGRNVVAIGSNESTAKMCGVAIDKVKIGVYALAGFFFGMAGIMQLSRTGIGDPTIAGGEELKMIAAVVIGGASLSGGQGSVLGAAFGTLIMTTINMGSSQMGVPNWIQEIATGAIILIAVGLDRWRLARAASRQD